MIGDKEGYPEDRIGGLVGGSTTAEYERQLKDARLLASKPPKMGEWVPVNVPVEETLKGYLDKQVGGTHYQLPIQPIDYIVKNNLGYREVNVIKYVTRHKNKNGAEDIKKAIHYLEMIKEEYENG